MVTGERRSAATNGVFAPRGAVDGIDAALRRDLVTSRLVGEARSSIEQSGQQADRSGPARGGAGGDRRGRPAVSRPARRDGRGRSSASSRRGDRSALAPRRRVHRLSRAARSRSASRGAGYPGTSGSPAPGGAARRGSPRPARASFGPMVAAQCKIRDGDHSRRSRCDFGKCSGFVVCLPRS
jgi:hypothetical protein